MVLSPSQIKKSKIEKAEIKIDGLKGNNFKSVGIV